MYCNSFAIAIGRSMRAIDLAAGSTLSNWRRERGDPSLADVHRTIAVSTEGSRWHKLTAFLGPGYLVAVGYMDPGNWATSLAGGARFGYALLFIALLSNIMAIILQHLCARMAVATGRDLAQACRDAYPRLFSYPLWFLAEIAICATDLAEVIGTAIGLNLLFGVPLEIGVVITALDVFLILYLQNKGFRWIEAFIITLLGVIAICFLTQIAMANPDWAGVIRLYLHSGIVQTRAYGITLPEKREAVTYATIDSTVALMSALTINASILILAAAAFNRSGNTHVEELEKAHTLLSPLLGSAMAPTLFAIALLCCGMNSTVTATMAGQIVMEGFLDIRLPPWLRRLVTRLVAIVPAVLVTLLYGSGGTAKLLIFSQVILSLQLPFAIIPLVMITAERRKMGELRAPRWLTGVAGVVAAIIVILNVKLIFDFITAG